MISPVSIFLLSLSCAFFEKPSVFILPSKLDIIAKQRIYLVEPARLGKPVTAIYEITTKGSCDSLQVVFCRFQGVRPVNNDTLRKFNAEKGMIYKFAIRLKYFDTPAIFEVRLIRKILISSLSFTRYLMNKEKGAYGSLKEIQFFQPLEYRFNPILKKFESEILGFEKDRWQINRGIIDTIQTIYPILSDSLCLLLYADVFKTLYPKELTRWPEKANYLIQQNWLGYQDEKSRNKFLSALKILNEKQQKEAKDRMVKAQEDSQRRDYIFWLLSWIIPAILLVILAIYLLALNRKQRSRVVTTKTFDKIVVYFLYLIAIGITLYFSWPYLGIKIPMQNKIEKDYKESIKKALNEIEKLDTLKSFNDYEIVSIRPLFHPSGIGASYVFIDKKDSKIGVEYSFTIEIEPDNQTYKIRMPSIMPKTAIEALESDKRIVAFLKNNKIKQTSLCIFNKIFVIEPPDKKCQITYDSKRKTVINYKVPFNFEAEEFPELKRLRGLIKKKGFHIKQNSIIEYEYQKYQNYAVLRIFLEECYDDRLVVSFFSDAPLDFTYQWIPSPVWINPPQEIINQIYKKFTGAGLDSVYVAEHFKLLSIKVKRIPDYFINAGDRCELEAKFKWLTGLEWIDEINNGEGIIFNIAYRYYADSVRLGECLGKPARNYVQRWETPGSGRFYLRPFKKIIPRSEARKRLFNLITDEEHFDLIYAEVVIPEKPNNLGNYIYLVGAYAQPTQGCISYALYYKVDLETGTTLKPGE